MDPLILVKEGPTESISFIQSLKLIKLPCLYKTSRRKLRENLSDLEVSKDFSDMTPKASSIIEKINKFRLIKIKYFSKNHH